MRYKIKDGDIQNVTEHLNRTRRTVFRKQSKYLSDQFGLIKRAAYQTTMVATGETRSKLFSKSGIVGSRYYRCETGYNPTSNNQSIAQEFEEVDKPVHRTVEEHYRNRKSGDRTPKCSRQPNDLFTLYGENYDSNTSARRGALGWSIKKVFSTPTVPIYRGGGGFLYVPDLSKMAWRLAVIARAITGGASK